MWICQFNCGAFPRPESFARICLNKDAVYDDRVIRSNESIRLSIDIEKELLFCFMYRVSFKIHRKYLEKESVDLFFSLEGDVFYGSKIYQWKKE